MFKDIDNKTILCEKCNKNPTESWLNFVGHCNPCLQLYFKERKEKLKKEKENSREVGIDLDDWSNHKVVITLPDGDFEYEIIKGKGNQDRKIADNEIYRCSSCTGEYYGEDGYERTDDGLMCRDCWQDGDDDE